MIKLELKNSRYNVKVKGEDESYLFNTRHGSAISLNNKLFRQLDDVLNIIEKTREYKEDDEILRFIIENGFVVPHNENEYQIIINEFNNNRNESSNLSLLICPTLQCNMNCFYCYQDRNLKSSFGADDAIALVNFVESKLTPFASLHITWFGGEPLFSKKLLFSLSEDLLELANKYCVKYTASIVTNGFFLNKETAIELKKHRVMSAQVTLDGSEIFHDKVRRSFNKETNKSEKTFYKIIKNIREASELMKITIRVNVNSINFSSIKTLIDELALADLSGMVQVYFHPIFNYKVIEGESNYITPSSAYLTMQQFSEIETKLLIYSREKGFWIREPFNVAGCFAMQKNSFVIESNGDVKKCDNCIGVSGTSLTSIHFPYYTDASNLEYWMNYNLEENEHCKKCTFLPVCFSRCPHSQMTNQGVLENCPSFKFNWDKTFPLYISQRAEQNKEKKMS